MSMRCSPPRPPRTARRCWRRVFRVPMSTPTVPRTISNPLLVEPAFAGRLKPTEKSRVGMGLIRRVAKPGQPLYKRRLGAAEVERRLADFLASVPRGASAA